MDSALLMPIRWIESRRGVDDGVRDARKPVSKRDPPVLKSEAPSRAHVGMLLA